MSAHSLTQLSIEIPLDPEIWVDIPEWEGFYQSSSHGRVRSIERMSRINSVHGGKRKMGGIVRKLTECDGYLFVSLTAKGKRKSLSVSRLILLSFIGDCPDGMECCHNNGDSLNNNILNLRWDTHFNNNQDRKKHGNYLEGESHVMAKLTKQDAFDIKYSAASGVETAKKYGIGTTQVSRIRSGESWQNL